MQEFNVTTQQVGSVLVIRTKGYIEKNSGKIFFDTCRDLVSPTLNKVVINITESPVINSSGLSATLNLIELIIDKHDGTVGICGISNLVKAAFRTTGICELVTEYPTEADAIQGLS